MTIHAQIRGARPVANIEDMDPIEAASVRYFRLWFDGRRGQKEALEDFHAVFGQDVGNRHARQMRELLLAVVENSRRPLMHHQNCCQCVGADECAFANIMAAAAAGDREDTALFTSLLVRPDVAMCLSGLAQEVGMILRQLVSQNPHHKLHSIPQNTRIH